MRNLFKTLTLSAAVAAIVAGQSSAQTLWTEAGGGAPRLLDRSVIDGTLIGRPPAHGNWNHQVVRFDDDLIPFDQSPQPLPEPAARAVPSDSTWHAYEGSGEPSCGIGDCDSWVSSCLTGCRHWSENVTLFSGTEAWKNRADDDGQNNFGFRNGFNVGVPIGVAPNIGMQFGGAWGVYDLQGREFGNTGSTESHLYGTAGIFRRSDVHCGDRISWGVAWDYLNANDFGQNGNQTLDLNQLRGQIGYAVGHDDELGFRGAWGMTSDTITAGGPTFQVDIVDQYNVYWKHVWQTGATTDFYVGAPGGPTNLGEVIVGFNGLVPLNDHVSMYGGAHLIPGSGTGNPVGPVKRFAEDLWSVSTGFEFSLGGKARAHDVSGNRWMPLMPVAGFGSMSFQTPENTEL